MYIKTIEILITIKKKKFDRFQYVVKGKIPFVAAHYASRRKTF